MCAWKKIKKGEDTFIGYNLFIHDDHSALNCRIVHTLTLYTCVFIVLRDCNTERVRYEANLFYKSRGSFLFIKKPGRKYNDASIFQESATTTATTTTT